MSVKSVFDFSKFKRQVEILGLCLPHIKDRDIITLYDFCELFEISIATIERDLSDLRERGIPIHSTKNGGIIVDGNVMPERIRNELLRYLSLCYADNLDELLEFDGTNTDTKINRLSMFINLQEGVDKKYIVIISFASGDSYNFVVRKILRKNKKWFIVVENKGYFELFPFENFVAVKRTGIEYDKPLIGGLEDFINKSFDKLSNQKFKLIISFATKINGSFPSQISRIEILSENADGRFVASAICNNYEEVVPWLLMNSGDIIVLEPPELKEKIIQIAEIIFSNYDPNHRIYFSRSSFHETPFIKNEFGVIKYYNPSTNDFMIKAYISL